MVYYLHKTTKGEYLVRSSFEKRIQENFVQTERALRLEREMKSEMKLDSEHYEQF